MFFLCILAGLMAIVSGASLGDVVDEMVNWFNEETDNIKDEAIKDHENSTTERVDDGVSFTYDLIFHLISVFYGWFVLSVISTGGYIFMLSYTNLDDDFDCEFDPNVDFNSYAGAFPFILSMTSYDDCIAKFD